MADTNLKQILSGLYNGLNKLNTKSDAKDTYISGIIGANYASPSSVQDRLNLLEAGTSAASGVLTIAGKAYTPSTGDKAITIDDIQATYVTALAENATGLAAASAVWAADKSLQDQIDDIASSFLTGVVDDNTTGNALTLDTDGQKVTGKVLVDGDTIVLSGAENRITANLALKKLATAETGYAASYQLQTAGGTVLGDTINIFKDQFLSGATYDASTEEIILNFIVADPAGTDAAAQIKIPVSGLVHEYEGSDAITVDWDGTTTAGKTSISLKLDNAGEDFLSITSNGLLLSGVQEAIDAAKGEEATELAELSGKVSGAFGSDATAYVVTAAQDGITKSAYTMGGATLSATPAATVLATEAAVKAADDALEAKLSAAYTDDEIVIGTGSGIEASGYKLGADGDTYESGSAPDNNKVMTEASFYNYVETELSGLATDVATLVAAI